MSSGTGWSAAHQPTLKRALADTDVRVPPTLWLEDTGEVPILLLDDVFSELDPSRSEALVNHLPEGQALLTTAAGQPPGTRPELIVQVSDAHLHVVDQ